MRIKTLIAGTAMVLAFGVGSAIASDTVENTATAPQHLTLLSDGLLANVAPMPAAQLEAVRGAWWLVQNLGGAAQDVVDYIHNTGNAGNDPRFGGFDGSPPSP